MKLFLWLSLTFAPSFFLAVEVNAEIKKVADTTENLANTSDTHLFDKIELVAEWYEVTTRYVLKEVPYQEYICDKESTSAGNWHEFYHIPPHSKPQALSAAIAGLDLETARLIVNARQNYFGSKPKTWNKFKNIIRRIEADFYKIGLYYDIVGKNGDLNIQNLGYPISAFGCDWEERAVKAQVPEEDKKLIKTFPKEVRVEFKNSILLKGEKEAFTVTWDGDVLDVLIVRPYNKYLKVIKTDEGLITLESTGREPVAPLSSDFSYSLTKESDRLYLNVRDSRYEELSEISGPYKVAVSFSLIRAKKGCLSGEKEILRESMSVAEGQGQIDVTELVSRKGDSEAQILAGEKYYAGGIEFQRVGVPYFQGASAKQKTQQIEY